MDKRTLIGLGLIVAILVTYNLLMPKPEQTSKDENDKDSTEQVIPLDDDTDLLPESNLIVLGDTVIDSVDGVLYKDTLTDLDTFIANVQEPAQFTAVDSVPEPSSKVDYEVETYTLESDLLSIEVSNKGGRITSAYLKEFQTYQDFIDEKKDPLQLFDDTTTYGLVYNQGDSKIVTDELEFKVKEQTENSITLESKRRGKTIGYTYTLKDGAYDLDFNVYFDGFTDSEVEDVRFTTDFFLLASEKHYPNEERLATLYWQYKDDDYDYIQTSEDEEMEEDIEWMSFRGVYFTAILSNKTNFSSKGDSEVNLFAIDDEEQTKYVKEFKADVNLGATNAQNTVEMSWYFGPVDYDVLAAYDNGTEDIVELGTGLFRFINKYAIRPLFMGLLSSGMSIGLAILLLTVIVKLVLSPVNYKMYKSSAMMKVLRPEIEKISKKYPKKEQAMEKQRETMALYKETGVSPLAGCVPMLIQMPILFAIFRLFPSEIALRQRSFLWAEDLSTYDSPIMLGFDIPFYGDHVSLFTLLMAITTLVYTHYNSSNMQQPTQEGMPNLKYIMYFFPIMMIFFFNSYSSGLSFYYFISTLMTIGIMFAISVS
jgi:YidC/Oxa1 family membrane protein insertase